MTRWWHGPSVRGRARADRGLLALIGVVVTIATLLASAIAPLTLRTSDRAVGAAVREAGARSSVVATTSDQGDDGGRVRDPGSAAAVRARAEDARRKMAPALARVVRPSVTSLTTPELQLLDAGPGRYLRLAYVTGPRATPDVRFVDGGPPKPGVPAAQADESVEVGDDPWPVQVAISQDAATALSVGTGDRLPTEDTFHRAVAVTISGVFVPVDAADPAWAQVPELLRPIVGSSDTPRTTVAAMASADSLPDLRLAVPEDDLTSHVTFAPVPSRVRWQQSDAVARAVVALQASVGRSSGLPSWDSQLDQVLDDARSQVSAARGQASVLVTGLLVSAALVLVLAAGLLTRRRAGATVVVRERGASLPGIFVETLVESAAVAALGSALGVLLTRALVGDVGWLWVLPVLVVAVAAPPVLATVGAARSGDRRRAPANRSARDLAQRVLRTRRLLLEGTVVAVAAVAVVALRQRGVVDGAGAAASSALTWWSVAGGLVVVRLLPLAMRPLMAAARRGVGVVRLVATARTSQATTSALSLLVLVVIMAQLTIGTSLFATERNGQADGAWASVGSDARLEVQPDVSVTTIVDRVSEAPDVSAVVAARVEDGVRVSTDAQVTEVRLVVVDATAFRRLLARTPLPDVRQLSRLRPRTSDDGTVRALATGGGRALLDGGRLRWDETLVPLRVVGTAPRVGGIRGPVVVVDAAAFAATGAVAPPGTVWATGAGAGRALRAAAGSTGDVDTLVGVLDARRSAPLAAGLDHLALAAAGLLLALAIVSVLLAAAADGPSRRESLARLRSLGLRHADSRRLLVAELAGPVVVGAVGGAVIGLGAALATFDALALELVTGQTASPSPAIPWWTAVPVVVVVAAVTALGLREAARMRRTTLASLLGGAGQ